MTSNIATDVRLSFEGSLNFVWVDRNFMARTTDADGTIDYGNIDGFEITPEGYYLDGDWGAVKIRCNVVRLTLRD